MKLGIIQSCYIPWKGYFDFIDDCDQFVIMDDVQYTRRDWRNRNVISTERGEKWLTIPLWNKGRYDWNICEMETAHGDWAQSHYDSIRQAYGDTPHFERYAIRDIYNHAPHLLSEINWMFTERICLWLGITTPVTFSQTLNAEGTKTLRLLDICKKMGADVYLSGPSAMGYLDTGLLARNGIETQWKRYEYEPYPGMRTHNVTVLDMLFKVGADRRYWKCSKTS